MAESRVLYTGDGVTQNFNVPFPYISRDHVKVYVNLALQFGPLDYVWIDDSTIRFLNPPPKDSAVLIKRETPHNKRLVDFQDGAVLTEADLDLSATQLFYLTQEIRENYSDLIDNELLRFAKELGIGSADPANIIAGLVAQILNDETAAELAKRIADIDALGQAVLGNEALIAQVRDSLQTQLNQLLESTMASVFVQPEPPVPGVDGVPDPIPAGARWYDSDDNNHPYLWDAESQTWIDLEDPRIGQNQAAITALGVRMTNAEESLSAHANALDVLDTTVSNINDTLTAHSQQLTQLGAALTSAEGDIAANAAGLASLTTRVSVAEDAIDAHAADITALQVSLSGLETDVAGNASAITGLDARVGAAEDALSAHASSITSLQSSLAGLQDNVNANASAIAGLDTRIDAAESQLTTHAASITSLSASLDDLQDEVNANARAVSALETRVTSAENAVSSQATQISAIQSTVNGHSATITTLAQTDAALQNDVASLQARYGVTLNTNGYITGFTQFNDGKTGTFAILADKFYIVDPAAGGRNPKAVFAVTNGVVTMQNVLISDAVIGSLTVGKLTTGTLNADVNVGTGRIVWDNGVYMKVAGVGFGTNNQFIEWFGPKMPINQCNESSAIMYLKTNGDAYYGGRLHAGALTNSGQTSDISNRAEVVVGPFGSEGRTILVTYAYSASSQQFVPPPGEFDDYYDPTATIVLERRVGTGSWTTVATRNITGSHSHNGPVLPPDVWEFRQFMSGGGTYTDNLKVTDDRTYRLRLTARSLNPSNIQQRLSIVCVEE